MYNYVEFFCIVIIFVLMSFQGGGKVTMWLHSTVLSFPLYKQNLSLSYPCTFSFYGFFKDFILGVFVICEPFGKQLNGTMNVLGKSSGCERQSINLKREDR